MKKIVVHPDFLKKKNTIEQIIDNFDSSGEDYGNQNRNSLKLFPFYNTTVNVKSFKKPNLINQVAYRFFRKSKAQRSYEYACKLQRLSIGTPQPIAYFEKGSFFLFKKSYYLSEQLDCELTFRELTLNENYPNLEKITREFTQFTFTLHEKGIHFLDHSPGNTLIKKEKDNYSFHLVDLNRMEFTKLDFDKRIKNFARLTKEDYLITIMADEYAKLSKKAFNEVYKQMCNEVNLFQNKFTRKKEMKKRLKFWK